MIPQTGLPVGFYLRKKETGHAGGRAVLCWARIWPCWARDVAVLGALGWVGRGIWPCWAVWAWVGGGVLLWWARWAGLGADLAACAWCTLYMSSSCLHDVFVFIFMCISDVLFDLIDLLALFGVYAGIIFSKVYNENTWEKKHMKPCHIPGIPESFS